MLRLVTLALALVGASAFTPSVLKTSVTRRAAVTRGAMEMRTPIMAGNWKMNPPTVAEAKALAEAVGAVAKGDEVEVRERRRCRCHRRHRQRHHRRRRHHPARLTTLPRRHQQVVVTPPYPFLDTVVEALNGSPVKVRRGGARSPSHARA